MEMKGFSLTRKDLISILLIFCLALGIRLIYQHSTEVRNQIISDAKEYFLGAYNLCFFGVYSTSCFRGFNFGFCLFCCKVFFTIYLGIYRWFTYFSSF